MGTLASPWGAGRFGPRNRTRATQASPPCPAQPPPLQIGNASQAGFIPALVATQRRDTIVADDILCTGKHDITTLIAQCAFLPADAYVLLEELPQRMLDGRRDRQELLRFARYGNIKKDQIRRATSGRIFNREFELRWERDAGATSVMYLGEAREVAGLTKDDGKLENLSEWRRWMRQSVTTCSANILTRANSDGWG